MQGHSTDYTIVPRFRQINGRRLFFIEAEPADMQIKGVLVYVHPFGDELNRSRRRMAMHAQTLAAKGWRVVMPDLFGCGDSEGLLEQSAWGAWIDDLVSIVEQESNDKESKPVFLWGLRLGSLLASAVAARVDVDRVVLWAPILNGEHYVDQLMRVSVLSTSRELKASRAELWQRLREGDSLELAGYTVTSPLALGISEQRLLDLQPVSDVVIRRFSATGSAVFDAGFDALRDAWSGEGSVNLTIENDASGAFWRILGAPLPADDQWLQDFEQ